MSMMARFVTISPDRLKEILDDPESVSALFEEQTIFPQGPSALTDEMRQRAERMFPQALVDSLARMDPATREALNKRLESIGIRRPLGGAGATQSGAEQLMKLMAARAARHGSPAGAAPSQDASISLEKAWHGIHYLLCGATEPDGSVLGQTVMGGTEIGDDDGYGPARYFDPKEVADISRELSAATLEAQMKARYDPARMSSLKIYPFGWSPADADWLIEEYRHLRDFYAKAAASGSAIVTCIV